MCSETRRMASISTEPAIVGDQTPRKPQRIVQQRQGIVFYGQDTQSRPGGI